jgi:hypothetical protein
MRGAYDGSAGRAHNKLARAVRRSAGFGLIAVGMSLAAPSLARADEGGVSFWFPGQFGSLAAVPQAPGWVGRDTQRLRIRGRKRKRGRSP